MQTIADILNSEESTSTTLAQHLESLAVHYDKISEALKDSEAGDPFEEEDLKGGSADCGGPASAEFLGRND
jgi:autophagy-related protein 17